MVLRRELPYFRKENSGSGRPPTFLGMRSEDLPYPPQPIGKRRYHLSQHHSELEGQKLGSFPTTFSMPLFSMDRLSSQDPSRDPRLIVKASLLYTELLYKAQP